MTVPTSKVGVGTAMRAHNYLLIPEQTKSPAGLGSMPARWQAATESGADGSNASEGLDGIFLLLN
jgi:hypothetical protein